MNTLQSPSKSSDRQKTQQAVLIRSVAMATPAVRMLVVAAYADSGSADGTFVEIEPVLALVAKVSSEYARYASSDRHPETAPTHEGMSELGWTYQGACGGYIDYDVLIYSKEYGGVCDASFTLGNCSNGVYKIVPAPWPAEEDETRLKDLINDLKVEAIEKVTKGQAKRP